MSDRSHPQSTQRVVGEGDHVSKQRAVYDPALRERARTQWQFGDWHSLSQISREQLEQHPDRAEIALLAAAGNLQAGHETAGRELARLAWKEGCSRESIARVLISGVHNSIARAWALAGESSSSDRHFQATVTTGMPEGDQRLLSRARASEQLLQLEQAHAPNALQSTNAGARMVSTHGGTNQRSTPFALPRHAAQTGRPTRWVVCCHHKSGTNFLVKTFRSIAKKQEKVLWMKFYEPLAPPDEWDICIHQHSRVHDLLGMPDVRGMRCIRHPMALIYSAALYHQKCSEPWVDVPLEGFSVHTYWCATDGILYNRIKDPETSMEVKTELMNRSYGEFLPDHLRRFDSSYDMMGKTYRELLSEQPTMEEKILFEMRAYSRGVIHEMTDFPADDRFFTVRLEDLSWDRQMLAFYNGLLHLGLEGTDLIAALNSASENYLWNVGAGGAGEHATTGVSEQWRQYFRGEVLEEFRRLFGNAEEVLGYPPHTESTPYSNA